MLSTVLKSERAVQANIAIMRAFVKLREMIASHKDLAKRLDELEAKYDGQFKVVFDAIRALVAQPEPKQKKIGFIRERQVFSGRLSPRACEAPHGAGKAAEIK